MFDLARWQKEAQQRLLPFLKRPRREPFLSGSSSLFAYLVLRTIEPFLETYEQDPIEATIALAMVDRGPGANFLVRHATPLRYQGAILLRRELAASASLRSTVEQLLLRLGIIELLRNGLDDLHSEWLRVSLSNELAQWLITGELRELREALESAPWQARYAAIQSLRTRAGQFTAQDLALLRGALRDASNHVRAAAARSLGHMTTAVPIDVQRALLDTAVHDHDLGTRYAAARALGTLCERLEIEEIRDQLISGLGDEDSFVRSAASLVLGQLGEAAATPEAISGLCNVLKDGDPYAREAAAQALGLLGPAAATQQVLVALAQTLQDSDFYVHEAASSALSLLREYAPIPQELINSSLVA